MSRKVYISTNENGEITNFTAIYKITEKGKLLGYRTSEYKLQENGGYSFDTFRSDKDGNITDPKEIAKPVSLKNFDNLEAHTHFWSTCDSRECNTVFINGTESSLKKAIGMIYGNIEKKIKP